MSSYYHPLDLQFAKSMMRISDTPKSPVGELICRMLSYQVRQGHVCLDFDVLPPIELWPSSEQKERASLESSAAKERRLLASSQAQDWLSTSPIVSDDPENHICPLIWQNNRLYLHRYYHYEVELTQTLYKLCSRTVILEPSARDTIKDYIADYFPQVNPKAAVNYQALALVLSLLRSFLIISGGPGTGKTSILTHILRLQLQISPQLCIALAAPTGKAAMRIQESLATFQNQKGKAPELLKNLEIYTLQKLLGKSRHSHYHYNENRKLPYDLLVIDEASMLDLPLFVHTLRALEAKTRLILLGDPNQLFSVEIGAVFNELCRAPHQSSNHFSSNTISTLKTWFGISIQNAGAKENTSFLQDSIIVLQENHRFSKTSGIFLLSESVRLGDAKAALSCLNDTQYNDVHCYESDISSQECQEILIHNFAACYTDSKTPEKLLASLQKFSVFAPFRQGSQGTEALNQWISQCLTKKRIIPMLNTKLSFYPILIQENDYALELFNGDLGLVFLRDGKLRGYFHQHNKEIRDIPLELLPPHSPSFVMTVHKSQGSEWDHIVLILPEDNHEYLSRELVYTAVTRARKKVSIFAKKKVLEKAIVNPMQRSSGLSMRTAMISESAHEGIC